MAIINATVYGKKLPDLSNPGNAADLLRGKQLLDTDGKPVTGTMPVVTQATPSISVSSSGLITAKAEQSAGYVSQGTKSATKQLATLPARTITPTKTDNTIYGQVYLTGDLVVSGDANLLADNIKSGVSIFGISGSYTGKKIQGIKLNKTNCTAANGYIDVDISGCLISSLEDVAHIDIELTYAIDASHGDNIYVFGPSTDIHFEKTMVRFHSNESGGGDAEMFIDSATKKLRIKASWLPNTTFVDAPYGVLRFLQ